MDELMKRGVPTVRIGRAQHFNDTRVPVALPDLPAAGRMAADHFESHNFRYVGFVGSDSAAVVYDYFQKKRGG